MKKRKLLRNVSLVALSAVLVGGTAMAFTGCAKGGSPDPDVLTIYIFCNDSDATVNQNIVNRAMDEFNETHKDELGGRTVTAKVENQADQLLYFTTLSSRFANNEASDIVYVSPKYVTTYASQGKVVDLTPYLTGAEKGMSGSATQAASEIWPDALELYAAYLPKGEMSYANASDISYDASAKKWKETESSTEVGIYGLPKDYSSFAMGYNRNFFTDELKEAYTTMTATQNRKVTSWKYVANKPQAAVTHTGANMSGVVRNALTGADAPLINIGVPTTYKPFNFYKYADYAAALAAGDPVALSVEAYTDGEGYTVTIPGWPDESFEITDEKYQDENAPYRTDMGHITYTYAEYGALQWAMSYYLTTFAWDQTASELDEKAGENTTNGGKYLASTKSYQNVYGGEQYENSEFGINGYLLPWLASNDVTLITSDYTRVWNTTDEPATFGADDTVDKYVGYDTETVHKMTLDGAGRDAEVQYGMDAANFIETYGAFQEIGSTWNANCGTSGDAASANDRGNNSGWTYFTMGASIFYGAGTWDASTRNESSTDDFWFGQMPVPVSEKFALYSTVRNGYYKVDTYSNAPTDKGVGDAVGSAYDPETKKPTGDYAQREDVDAGRKTYTEAEILQNQLKRQDKWGARMDSVGYAVNTSVLEHEGDHAWKKEAAFLVLEYLTINRDSQVELTYAGAQMPNFVDQCEEFLKYQDEGYEDGAFSAMITPDGDVSRTGADGRAVWNAYYEYAAALASQARTEKNNANSTMTVKQYIDAHSKITINGKEEAVKYNADYADTRLADFGGNATSLRAYSMRVLNMVNFSEKDRDLNMRMEYGLNSAKDQLMYTQDTSWMGELTETAIMSPTPFLAYYNKDALKQTAEQFLATVATKPADANAQHRWWTPAVSLIVNVRDAQLDLNNGNFAAATDKQTQPGDGAFAG